MPSKQSYLYVFNRETGEPVWPIVETPVPKGDVPGEWYAPTQPIPTKPAAYGRPGIQIPDDLIDFTPEMRAEALEVLKRYKWGGDFPYSGTLYNPPIVGNVDGLVGALNHGNASGGTNWPGAGFDPETQIVYAQAKGMDLPKTGQRGSVGVLITKTLVIAGDPQVTTTDEHPRGAMLRAYNKATGEQVGAVYLPAPQSGSPMTYAVNGRQFIVVAVSGGPYSGEYLSFSLPAGERGSANGGQ